MLLVVCLRSVLLLLPVLHVVVSMTLGAKYEKKKMKEFRKNENAIAHKLESFRSCPPKELVQKQLRLCVCTEFFFRVAFSFDIWNRKENKSKQRAPNNKQKRIPRMHMESFRKWITLPKRANDYIHNFSTKRKWKNYLKKMMKMSLSVSGSLVMHSVLVSVLTKQYSF